MRSDIDRPISAHAGRHQGNQPRPARYIMVNVIGTSGLLIHINTVRIGTYMGHNSRQNYLTLLLLYITHPSPTRSNIPAPQYSRDIRHSHSRHVLYGHSTQIKSTLYGLCPPPGAFCA